MRKQLRLSPFALVLTLAIAMPAAISQQSDLAQLAEQAKTGFTPITPEQAQQARAELDQQIASFERYLVPGSRKSEGWKRYLEWQKMTDGLADPQRPDFDALRTTLVRLRSGATGTDLAPFRRLATAIENYVDRAEITRVSNQQEIVGQQIDLVQRYLDRYRQDHSARARYEIERRLDLLTGLGQSAEYVAAVEREFNRANIEIGVSEAMLAKVASDEVNKIEPVTDCILGTSIHGMGHTTGNVTVSTMPSDNRAVVFLHINGVTHSDTKGYNGPVVITSRGVTHFTVNKRVDLEDSNFWNYPAQVDAHTRTQTCSVKKQGGGLGSRLIEGIAERQVAEKKPRADAIAGQHAEERIARNVEKEFLPKLQDARYEYQEQFKRPFSQRNADPKFVHFSSTDRAVEIRMLQAGRGLLGADTSAPALDPTHDVSLRLHETGVANVVAALVGGATISQAAREADVKTSVQLPDWLDEALERRNEKQQSGEAEAEESGSDQQEFKPWAITLRRGRPATVEFQGGTVKLILHATAIEAGDSVYRNWDIAATYTPTIDNGHLVLSREGDIEVVPTRFDQAEGGRLTSREIGERANLTKELNRQAENGRGLKREMRIDPIEVGEGADAVGTLQFSQVASDAGWLSLELLLP
jgi:transposase-like protein